MSRGSVDPGRPVGASRCWFRAGPAPLTDASGALFDPLSGETHFLAVLPLLLLESMTARPTPTSELVRRLAGDVDPGKEGWGKIEAALLQLESAELVESVIPTDVRNDAGDARSRTDP